MAHSKFFHLHFNLTHSELNEERINQKLRTLPKHVISFKKHLKNSYYTIFIQFKTESVCSTDLFYLFPDAIIHYGDNAVERYLIVLSNPDC